MVKLVRHTDAREMFPLKKYIMVKKKEAKGFKDRKQFLFRFLKEKKIFSKSNLIRFDQRGTLSRISHEFFDSALCWRETREGHPFWLKIQCEFILFIIKYDKNKLFDMDSLSNYFSELIFHDYFSETSLTKKSEYYRFICNEYFKFKGSIF
jgi:hypothetical protein